ncbi:KH domain-containing protein [candidate division KSB1 bacterium]|nr:KH domain-containing protein [candidate division KSB1 bacterium]RQW05244.1 MAG: KH domain-containing protein [candidate division KSB1 bacterium]
MKEFIENIIQHLVDKPEGIHVDHIIGEHTIVLELQVEVSDMGKVIGRNGQMANSLKTILAVT